MSKNFQEHDSLIEDIDHDRPIKKFENKLISQIKTKNEESRLIEKETKKKIFTSIFTKAYTNIVSNNESIKKSELKYYKADLTKSTPEQNFKYSPYIVFQLSYLTFIVFIVMYNLIK